MNCDGLENVILDLHDIALLLNYERASTEPRFRHTKLKEVADNVTDFQSIRIPSPDWTGALVPKIGFMFERAKKSARNPGEPDLPTTMLPNPIPSKLRGLTQKELETYYWQARNHDGCFKTVALFQHFIDLFPTFTQVRVRTAGEKSSVDLDYTTNADTRQIMEMDLIEPNSISLSCVLPDGMTYITGAQEEMVHAVLGFSQPSPNPKVDTILDLASLQFGDVGRGYKGRGLFVLEPLAQYKTRLEKYAKHNTLSHCKRSDRITGTPDDVWLREVAKKTKERWDKRATEPWCEYCGAPARKGQLLKRCSGCKEAYYCDEDHQKSSWTYHRSLCSPKN